MNLIQSVVSTLRTWVFKKKLLKFSDRYKRDPLACFYCPEMCRFSCPVAENLRHDGVTPRGKMSLLHLQERGFSSEAITGGDDQRLWFLDQCTGCGRCTEYCVYEVDVASRLREERHNLLQARDSAREIEHSEAIFQNQSLVGTILIAEVGRSQWWERQKSLLNRMGVDRMVESQQLHQLQIQWSRGKFNKDSLHNINAELSSVKNLWVESPEVTWFLFKSLQQDHKIFKGKIHSVWQSLYAESLRMNLSPTEVFHESYHLSRLLPRYDFSVPMYDKGSMPIHSGWNVMDCGGEGHYKHFYQEHADQMSKRFMADLCKDGRQLESIICQSMSCMSHLKRNIESQGHSVRVEYWLDRVVGQGAPS